MKKGQVLALGILVISSVAIIVVISALASSPIAQEQLKQQLQKAKRRIDSPCTGDFIKIMSPSPLPSASVGADYSYQLEAVGGNGPIKFGQYQSDPVDGTIKAFMPLKKDSIGVEPGDQFYSGDMDLYYWAGTPGYSGPPVDPWNAANKYWKLDGLYLRPTGEIFGQPKVSGHFEILIVATIFCPEQPQDPWMTWKYFHLEITE